MKKDEEQKIGKVPAKFHRRNKLIFDISMVVSYFIAVIPLIIYYHVEKELTSDLTLSFLIWIFGLLTGTLIAMVYSPFSEEEKTNFNTLSTVVVSFITGYLTSKLFEPILSNLVHDPEFVKTIEFMRIIIYTIGVLFALISVYIYRKYYLQGKDVVYTDKEKRNQEKES
ncbi:MAG: hypothetical protein R3A50_11495 [Saprospiraceae bacterium]|nr:hypothetical protein [Lewinellaceae bacterium]